MDLLEPYFKIAQDEAKKSPCVRRQYGSVIVYPGLEIKHVASHNYRIGRCCNGSCVRERLDIVPNGSVEVGAEIHSEAAVLLSRWDSISKENTGRGFFVLTGYDAKTGQELTGDRVYPCHTCSILIKAAGFEWIYIHNKDGVITPISVSAIIESREVVWSIE